MPDLSHVWDLHHSSWQCQILNPLSEARDWTHNLMVPSQVCFCCTTMGTPKIYNRAFNRRDTCTHLLLLWTFILLWNGNLSCLEPLAEQWMLICAQSISLSAGISSGVSGAVTKQFWVCFLRCVVLHGVFSEIKLLVWAQMASAKTNKLPPVGPA